MRLTLTFCLSHRLSTITKSDQIIVLHDGKIVERGSHDQLLAMGGRYSTMWAKQSTIDKGTDEETEDKE
jgi:ABC-type multidrug transport system fused ATPase/permease subunit